MIYVLTRTSNRPRFFAGLRASLAAQSFRDYVHVVHSDDPNDAYVEGDIVIRGPPASPELYIGRLLEAIQHAPPGWVVIVDDDDHYLPGDLQRISEITSGLTPDRLPIWRVRREADRISPAVWMGDLSTPEAGVCFEGAALHTSQIPLALPLITPEKSCDRRLWAGLAEHLTPVWVDEVFCAPQQAGKAGKGKWRRQDKLELDPVITVAVPILGRPHRIQEVVGRFDDPRLDLLFLPDAADEASVAELGKLGATYSFAPPAPAFGVPTYATKINHAFLTTDLPFLLYASDDVQPVGNWVAKALRYLTDERVGVLATNDQSNASVMRGRLATHGIVRRAYVEQYGSASLDDAGPVMFEGYRHHNCDVELSRVAIRRGAFKYAPDVILQHQKGAVDATYRLGQAHREHDKAMKAARAPEWRATTRHHTVK